MRQHEKDGTLEGGILGRKKGRGKKEAKVKAAGRKGKGRSRQGVVSVRVSLSSFTVLCECFSCNLFLSLVVFSIQSDLLIVL